MRLNDFVFGFAFSVSANLMVWGVVRTMVFGFADVVGALGWLWFVGFWVVWLVCYGLHLGCWMLYGLWVCCVLRFCDCWVFG